MNVQREKKKQTQPNQTKTQTLKKKGFGVNTVCSCSSDGWPLACFFSYATVGLMVAKKAAV